MKIFLAGTYIEHKSTDIIYQSRYNLESFYYIKPWQDGLIKRSRMFFLDSGAYTFLASRKTTQWDEYVERYADFITEHDVKYYFELDIDRVIGYEKVKEYRAILEKKTGRQCIPVWHKTRGIEEYKRLCDEYDYIAIGGLAIKEIKPNQHDLLIPLIREAHKRGTRVHGLGFTNLKKLKTYKFDSVDSTSWIASRYGDLSMFDGETMRPIPAPDGKRLKYRTEANTNEFSLREWIKFQKYAEDHL